MRRSISIRLWATVGFAVMFAGCQSSTENPPAGTQESGKATTSGARAGAGKTKALTIPAGTALSVRLDQEINTGKAEAGEEFSGTLSEPLMVGGAEVAPVGSAVTGKVTHVVSSGRLSRPAELSLALTSLKTKDGSKVEIATQPWGEKGPSHKKRDIEAIGGGAGAGVLIGALTGGKKGAAIGGAIGAGAGTGVAAATGKKEIVLLPEHKLTFRLSEPVTLR